MRSEPVTSTRVLTLVVASALFMESLVSTVIATSLAAIAADIARKAQQKWLERLRKDSYVKTYL